MIMTVGANISFNIGLHFLTVFFCLFLCHCYFVYIILYFAFIIMSIILVVT